MTKEHFESIASIINNVLKNDNFTDKEAVIKELVSKLVISFARFNEKFSPNKFINKCLKL